MRTGNAVTFPDKVAADLIFPGLITSLYTREYKLREVGKKVHEKFQHAVSQPGGSDNIYRFCFQDHRDRH
jgi:hypothetical protein